MHRSTCVLAAALLFSCARSETRPALSAEEQVRARAREAIDLEVDHRVEIIRAELATLDSKHPWAGRYYGGDGLGEIVNLYLAPVSGCAATWNGCLGRYGSNLGSVAEREGRLHIAFEYPNQPGESSNFYADFVVEGEGPTRSLRATKPDEHDRHAISVFHLQSGDLHGR